MRQRIGTRKAAVAMARKLVVIIYSILKNGTLFTVGSEAEKVELAAYHARKHLPVIDRYNQIRKSCKDYPILEEKTKSMYSNELGVMKNFQQGA
jgi:hypothetical protein